MFSELAYSRPRATAASLGLHAADANTFFEKRVLLTGEPEILSTPNGADCLRGALRLLPRICSNVTVVIPSGMNALLAEAVQIASQIQHPKHPISFLGAVGAGDQYDAMLSVGTKNLTGLPSTVINSNGWVARVSSGPTAISSACEQANPIGALAAASLGVSEIFKRLLSVKAARGPLFDAITFSLHSYQSMVEDPGPVLPEQIPLDALLVGAGAIGNGVVHLLSVLPTSGRMSVVDGQTYGEENLGTCLLIGPAQVTQPKALFAASVLKHRLDVRPYVEELSRFVQRIPAEVPFPRIVINALDNITARHEAQRLWPDVVIDGAIGQFECQVSSHPWGPDVACLMCLFREPVESAELKAAQLTGLRLDRVRNALTTVTSDDVASAPEEMKASLRSQVGRQICSVIQEAVARSISTETTREGFRPSVPFVATFSAAMVVAEIVREVGGWPRILEPRFQIDLLVGPNCGQHLAQSRRTDCSCVTRAKNINRIRADRRPTC